MLPLAECSHCVPCWWQVAAAGHGFIGLAPALGPAEGGWAHRARLRCGHKGALRHTCASERRYFISRATAASSRFAVDSPAALLTAFLPSRAPLCSVRLANISPPQVPLACKPRHLEMAVRIAVPRAALSGRPAAAFTWIDQARSGPRRRCRSLQRPGLGLNPLCSVQRTGDSHTRHRAPAPTGTIAACGTLPASSADQLTQCE